MSNFRSKHIQRKRTDQSIRNYGRCTSQRLQSYESLAIDIIKRGELEKFVDFLNFSHCLKKNLSSGESIPIRLFLSAYDLTPTMKDVNKKFSVRYYLNLVLVDEEDRRYFKQQVSKFYL